MTLSSSKPSDRLLKTDGACSHAIYTGEMVMMVMVMVVVVVMAMMVVVVVMAMVMVVVMVVVIVMMMVMVMATWMNDHLQCPGNETTKQYEETS